jgi:hypothetical protein
MRNRSAGASQAQPMTRWPDLAVQRCKQRKTGRQALVPRWGPRRSENGAPGRWRRRVPTGCRGRAAAGFRMVVRRKGPAVPRSGPASPKCPRRPHNRRRRPETARPSVVGRDEPGTALLAALAGAGPDGVPVAELLALTGMTRPTLYRHLPVHADAGRAVQVSRGYWRAAGPSDNSRPPGRPGSARWPGRHPRRDGNRPPGRDGQ